MNNYSAKIVKLNEKHATLQCPACYLIRSSITLNVPWLHLDQSTEHDIVGDTTLVLIFLLADIKLTCRVVSLVSSLLLYDLQLKLENSLFHHVVHAVAHLSFVGVVALPFFQTPLLLRYAIVFFVIILASNCKLVYKYSVQTFI